MKLALVALVLLLSPALGAWNDWSHLVVADSTPALSPRGVRVTYLGTNGYLLEARGTTLLIDPYFTRAALGTIALNLPLRRSPERIAWAMQRLPARIDGILVTHGHFDHLLDAPEIARRTGAKLYASPTSIALAKAAGLPAAQCVEMEAGEDQPLARATITALRASHDKLFGCCVPWPGELDEPPARPPGHASHWKLGEPLAFLIELNGRRIYVDSGGTRAVPPPALKRRVDLAILGVALPDSRARLPEALRRLRPRTFLPSHQDDFFRPLDRGFAFGSMSKIEDVIASAQQFPATKLILLDYFRAWTLP